VKFSSKFSFRLGFSDFNKIFFAMSSKYGNVFMLFLKDFYINYSLKSFLGFELEKLAFEVKHTLTLFLLKMDVPCPLCFFTY
jgi:hypothetical protein